jgi:hypothetical protein
LKSSHVCERALAASLFALGVGLTVVPAASADDVGTDGSSPGPVVVTPADPSENLTDSAASACGTFAQVLDDSSNYYGDFADSFEGSSYSDPAVDSSNAVGRTALRQGAALAMQTAGTPGLDPSIADPMRVWSLGASKLVIEMGLRIPGESLNSTATQMNTQAGLVLRSVLRWPAAVEERPLARRNQSWCLTPRSPGYYSVPTISTRSWESTG